eukprot:CAMPEP_0201726688 /NCGR_PEP_ID=MMETSP0593-20130828/10202_1 /ASSEMBLY_ACC=CAM_ASM_000672 /TAXON_ID=267983 /ORGANISM="Skeletonema japonicum, Strain CCMP2506" /LENGTH=54 /DNA_ID=CAMNT_0048218233 /DNA_START=62 /DNA_END=223 /DNA_ORIENTATION=+
MFRITTSIMVVAYAALVAPSTTNAFLTTPNNNNILSPLSSRSNTQLYNDSSSGG